MPRMRQPFNPTEGEIRLFYRVYCLSPMPVYTTYLGHLPENIYQHVLHIPTEHTEIHRKIKEDYNKKLLCLSVCSDDVGYFFFGSGLSGLGYKI